MAKKNKPKKINLEDLGGFVFSTNPDFDYEQNNEVESVHPSDQLLELHFEKKRSRRQASSDYSRF